MQAKNKLQLELGKRETLKKRVRQLRAEGTIPAVIVGNKTDSIPVQVEAKAFERIYQAIGGTSVLDVVLEGQSIPVIIQNVHRHHLKSKIVHVDFRKVDMKQKITVDVPILMHGMSQLEDSGKGTVSQETMTISLKCLPGEIPDEIVVDISDIALSNEVIHASDLPLPKGAALAHETDHDKVIAHAVSIRGGGEEETGEEEEAETITP